MDCTAATAPFDYDNCKAYDLSCTVKIDASGCVAVKDTCSNTVSAIDQCTSSEEGACYKVDASTCNF